MTDQRCDTVPDVVEMPIPLTEIDSLNIPPGVIEMTHSTRNPSLQHIRRRQFLALAAVPQLVAVGENGRIDEVWLGRLTPESEKSAAQFLSDHPGAQASNSARTLSP